jgi:uncharacterized membrane protein
MNSRVTPVRRASGRGAGVWLGIGLGGFFDGIVFHQILQWHHLVSVPYPPLDVAALQLNTLWDGLFHALTYGATVIGIFSLWRVGSRFPLAWLIGGILLGWGGFNLVEGLINHHLLGIHHVRPGPNQLLYDIGFLAWGAGMMGVGGILVRRPTGPATIPDRARPV